jgi:hypothetical protein
MKQAIVRRLAVVSVLTAALFAPGRVGAQDGPITIDAVAVSMGGPTSRSGTMPITIHIDRWSTDQDTSGLRDAVVEKGDDALLNALKKGKPVGNLAATGHLGWDIHYAHEVALPGGGRRIVFATDRPMSFAERTSGARSSDYEYLVGEVRVGADGKGQGTLVPRANVMYDGDNKTISIENYDSMPVRLTNVRVTNGK